MLACLSGSFSGLPVWEGQILRVNGANGVTIGADAAVRAVTTAEIEAEVLREARDACVERRRPIVAALSCVAQIRTVAILGVAIPGCGQEYGTVCETGLLTRYLVTAYTVHGGPGPGAVVYQFLELCYGGHAPAATPFLAGYVIAQLKCGPVVNTASVALIVVLGELDNLITVTVGAETVVHPCIAGLGAGLAPGVVVTVGAGT